MPPAPPARSAPLLPLLTPLIIAGVVYIAIVGLAEVRADADLADAPTILHLFSVPENERPAGLSRWDQAFLKALYRTEQTDRQQLEEIKTAVAAEIAPR